MSYIFTSKVVTLQFYPRTIIIFIVIDMNKWLFITLSSDVSPLKVRIPSRVYWLLQWHLASAGANWVLVIFRDFALNFEIPCSGLKQIPSSSSCLLHPPTCLFKLLFYPILLSPADNNIKALFTSLQSKSPPNSWNISWKTFCEPNQRNGRERTICFCSLANCTEYCWRWVQWCEKTICFMLWDTQ